jgi:hypothetical protein
MSKFARSITPTLGTGNTVDTNQWPERVNKHFWFRELLRLWRPAGVPSDKDDDGNATSLRLAVRDGYLSFYCEGQLAAEVKCGPRSFYETAHKSYLGRDADGGNGYQKLEQPADDEAQRKLADRLLKMADYMGREKVFVDEVIGSNANIFDVELALSHLKPNAKKRVALRLDIASLEPDGDGWKIVLWEAKMADNKDARSLTNPKTKEQHQNYSDWLGNAENEADIIAAARANCALLIGLRELAVCAGNTDIAALGEGIVAVGSDASIPLTLDKDVRYLIDARGEGGLSFIANHHYEKLKEFSGCVIAFQSGDELDLSKQ